MLLRPAAAMIDREEVEQVAASARLELTEDETDALRDDLADILESFESLDDIDTEDVDPAFHPVDLDTEPRDDTTDDCLSRDEALQNTDNTEDGYFRGPQAT